jgi:thiol-disulfide isomerase/thioredoxin
LDENNRAPISIAASRALRSRKKEEDEAKLRLLAQRVGFFYFHDDECVYCQQQVPILEKLHEEYGFSFLAIGVGNSTLEGVSFPTRMDQGQAQTLEVSRVPSIVMVWPEDNAAVLTQSFVPQSAFEARTITIARQLEILTDDDLEEMGIEQETLFVDLDLDDPDDLYQWVLNVRREMGYE